MSSWEEIADEVAPVGASAGGLATGAARRAAIAAPARPRRIVCPPVNPLASLDETLQGRVTPLAPHGEHYYIARPAGAFDTGYTRLEERLQRALNGSLQSRLRGASPRDLLFLDIETTGLSSSSPLFLIGAMTLRDNGEPHLDFFLARTPAEEKSALAAYHAMARGRSLVTFNGKSFDWPYIEARSQRHGLDFASPPAHLDVLYQARRRWKPLLPNCRLQTLELYLCGRQREGDIASSLIPQTYEEWLDLNAATGRGAHLLAPIVYHNAWDILTMADLMCRLEEC